MRSDGTTLVARVRGIATGENAGVLFTLLVARVTANRPPR